MSEPTQKSLTPQGTGDHEQQRERYGALLARFDTACAEQTRLYLATGGDIYDDHMTNGAIQFHRRELEGDEGGDPPSVL